MNLYELIETGANVKVEASAKDLVQFAEILIEKAKEVHQINNRYASEVQSGEERWLTTDEVARLCHVSTTTLWAWEKAGYLVASRLGRKKMYAFSDVDKLLHSNEFRKNVSKNYKP